MELLVIFVGLILFDLAAVRWGSDSRRLVSSCEECVAAQTGLARQTVVEAFDQLIGEGYAVSRPASGMYVARSLPEDLLHVRPRRRPGGQTATAAIGVSRRGAMLATIP